MIRSYVKFADALRSPEDAAEHPTYALFARFTERISCRDFRSLIELVHDDALLEIHAPPNLLVHGVWTGKDDIVAAIERNFSMLEVQQFSVDRLIISGDELYMFGSEVGHTKGIGTYAVKTAHWLLVEDGKFRRLTEIVANAC